jgi:hypothetical protein
MSILFHDRSPYSPALGTLPLALNKIVAYNKKAFLIVLFVDLNCILLRPILKVYDKLIVPVLPYVNSYILGKISHLKFIYFTLNNSSLVKLFLNLVLEESILIARPINEQTKTKTDKLFHKRRGLAGLAEKERKVLYNLYPIHRNDYNNLISDNSISLSRVKLTELLNLLYMRDGQGYEENILNNQYTSNIISKNNLKSKRITAIYLITNDNLSNRKEKTDEEIGFCYIGSSINLESRLQNHIRKWKKENYYDDEEKLRISFIYLNSHYLDKFKMLYPTYTLSKLE